jgi:hypothetical protein
MNVARASADVLISVITLLDHTLVAVTLATLLTAIITLAKVRLLIIHSMCYNS